MIERKMIGFDRRLNKEWLDAAAALVAEGRPVSEVRERLKQLLSPEQGPEAVEKTLIVLGRLWWRAPQDLVPMQTRALTLLPTVEPKERIAIYWALCMAIYPLFLDTARLTGRLLGLQGEAKLQQLGVRVADLWGDRETIPRAVQRITRSMVQWGVLCDTEQAGVYRQASPIAVKGDLGALLVEGLLLGHTDGGLTREQVDGHPALFPFELGVRPYELRQRSEFEVFRQGVDMEFIRLKK
ncbi:MAG TPA: hypothetical protein VD969_04775 [Symbiobacteriaceae bacterium]|nr:hypothetical protein [Symbiobacteriaceae bacterium]